MHPHGERPGQGRFTENAAQKPDGRDAYLYGGKKAGGVFAETYGGLCGLVAGGGPRREPRLAGGHEGDFRHGKNAVQHDEHYKNNYFHVLIVIILAKVSMSFLNMQSILLLFVENVINRDVFIFYACM